jgi:hypothetical protein
MANEQFWQNEYPCECGAKFIVELPAFTGASAATLFEMECSFCKRRISVTLPATTIKYGSVAPDQTGLNS